MLANVRAAVRGDTAKFVLTMKITTAKHILAFASTEVPVKVERTTHSFVDVLEIATGLDVPLVRTRTLACSTYA